MNLIPLDSWHRAQEPPHVGFRIDCLAVVEGCSCGPGVWMLSVVMKRVSRRVQFEAKCRETTSQCYGYHSLSGWSELAFSLIQR